MLKTYIDLNQKIKFRFKKCFNNETKFFTFLSNEDKIHDVIIIGGGISGSYLAFKLKDKFQDILIIEKSKVLGGRLCTKPVGSGRLIMDVSISVLKQIN